MTTTLTQTKAQLHEYTITLVSKELKAMDEYDVPKDVQVLRVPYFEPSITRQFLEKDLREWMDDYILADWRKIDTSLNSDTEF